jgi:hypothetical protein
MRLSGIIYASKWCKMQQLDLFEDTLQKKICRLEKWMNRIQRQMIAAQQDIYILKHVQSTKRRDHFPDARKITQLEMFGA